MKRMATFFLLCMLTAYMSMICYAGNSVLTEEQDRTDFGIYVTYIAGKTEYLTAPVKNGKSELSLPDGSVLTVSGVKDNSLTLVVYPIPRKDAEAWEWFEACMEGKGKNISPYEIYFIDSNENRIVADGVTISISNALENPAAFSLDSDGILTMLELRIRADRMIFRADGSCYYVLAEKTEPEISGEPTIKPTIPGTTGNNAAANNTGNGMTSGAQTGDDTPVEVYIALLMTALITILGMRFAWKKKII